MTTRRCSDTINLNSSRDRLCMKVVCSAWICTEVLKFSRIRKIISVFPSQSWIGISLALYPLKTGMIQRILQGSPTGCKRSVCKFIPSIWNNHSFRSLFIAPCWSAPEKQAHEKCLQGQLWESTWKAIALTQLIDLSWSPSGYEAFFIYLRWSPGTSPGHRS